MPGETGDAGVVHFTLSFWIGLPLAAALAAFFGMLFGAPTLRLRGDYLAIVTLGFGEIVPIVVRNWSDLTNGAAGLNGVAAPQTVRLELRRRCDAVLLRRDRHGGAADLHQHPIAGFAHRPRLDGDPRGRDRRRRDGRQPHQVQAAGVRHRRGVRRHDRRVLRREAADRDAGDVRLPGLGDDPGDDRVRRHRQRLGRRAGRLHPATSAIVVAAGPDRMAARARPAGRQRVAAASRPGAVDRTDLRPHPGRHDAVPAAGADPGDAPAGGAEHRSAARRDQARRLHRSEAARSGRR